MKKNFKIQNYKPEIDSLRAIAVFLVILFHYELLNFTGGFIGVDVFFVISGYLITNLLLEDLQSKRFSLFEFYIRRVRRILPALYTIVILSLISGYILFSPIHLGRLGESAASTTLGISNFYFWYESGYFNFDKLFKPLLHTWTLSVELQFYFFWPILIFFIYNFFRKKFKLIIFLIVLFCLTFSIIYSERATGFFYFTGFRLYEFAIGSFTYLISQNLKLKFNDALFLVSASLLVIASLIFNENDIFPSANALIPCLLCSLILLSSRNLKYFKNLFLNNYLIYVGKISYSLYLVHWPLLIFYKYIVIEPLSIFDKIGLILVSVMLSIFSYRFIELPFRRRSKKRFLLSNKKLGIYFLFSFFLIILTSQLLIFHKGFENRMDLKKIQTLNRLKIDEEKNTKLLEDVNKFNTKNPYFKKNELLIKTLIIGDSHAGNIYMSLLNHDKFSSILDIKIHGAVWAYCFEKENFRSEIVTYINQNIFKDFKTKKLCDDEEKNIIFNTLLSSADVIILSSRWKDKLDFKKIFYFLRKKSSAKIIMMGRTPEFIDIPTLYFKYDKNLNKIAYLKRNKKIDKLNIKIEKIAQDSNIIYFDRFPVVCKLNTCNVINNNKLLYSDHDHWSKDGAIFFGNKLHELGFLDLIIK